VNEPEVTADNKKFEPCNIKMQNFNIDKQIVRLVARLKGFKTKTKTETQGFKTKTKTETQSLETETETQSHETETETETQSHETETET
jgi:hypothetical protein